MLRRALGSCSLALLFSASCVAGEIPSDAPELNGGNQNSGASGGTRSGTGGSAGQTSKGGSGGGSQTGGTSGKGGGTSGGSGGKAASGGGSGQASGGSGGSNNGTGGAPISDDFKLLWRDDFDSFDGARWARAEHGFEENLAIFAPENVVVEGGFLKLKITNVPRGDKPYSAGEIYTRGTFAFGRFEARIRFAKGSGIVSSLFTYKDDINNSWQEIDIEHLGHVQDGIQYNLIYGRGLDRAYQPKMYNVDFLPFEEFHDYAIEWTPDYIRFYIDGKYTHQDNQAAIKDPARLRMNAWPTNNAVTNFAGPLNPNAIPCEAHYDWVAVYTYQP